MSWQSLLVIKNKTQHNITLANALGDITTVLPSSNYKHLINEQTTLIMFKFWEQENNFFMLGTLNISSELGVYIDRGDLPLNMQNIILRADINGIDYIQKTNLGSKVMEYNQFPNGGSIILRFENGA